MSDRAGAARAALATGPARGRQRDDAYGEVVRLVDELAADEEALRRFVDEHVGDIARLPADLADAALAALPAAALRQALVDAEASVLALLGETAAIRADS
jgi:hypothetical protein